jgi:hypothetical protein
MEVDPSERHLDADGASAEQQKQSIWTLALSIREKGESNANF